MPSTARAGLFLLLLSANAGAQTPPGRPVAPAPAPARPTVAAPAPPAPAAPALVGSQESAAADGIPDERPYPVRLHFLESNEHRHDLFFPLIRDRGGSYLGVGADQNYTLAAVANAEALWVVDIDGHVIDWHRIYAALLPVAASPADLVALIGRAPLPQIDAALRGRYPEAESSALLRAFQRDRPRISAYLRRELARRYPDGSGGWLSDAALYQRVRTLAVARRLRAHIGDLHGERTLVALGAAVHKSGKPFQTLYLSNVEQWFKYSPQFQRNLAALSAAPRAQVLRTLARWELHPPPGDRWHFSVQPLGDFLARMRSGELRLVQGLIPEMQRSERARGLSVLGESPLAALPGPSLR